MPTTRRDFIKGLGGALGAVVLTSSCGSGGDGGGKTISPPIPNGYRFYKVKSTGDSLPAGNKLAAMPGAVMVNNRDEIFFYGADETHANGFYELLIDYGGSRPVILQERKVVREGDVLKDSKKVSKISTADINDGGSFATVLHTDDKLSGVYLEREKQGIEPVAKYLTKLPDADGRFGAVFGDLDLHDDDDLLMVAHYAPDDSVQGQQGLFYLPDGEVNKKGSLVVSTEDIVPDSGGFVTGLGLVDMNDDGNYVLQAYGISPETVDKHKSLKAGEMLNADVGSMLINGNVKNPFSKVLKSASPLLQVRKGSTPEISSGEIKYGPRIGSDNNSAFIMHSQGVHLVLYYNGKQVISTGAITPQGSIVTGLSAPVVGSDGLLYYQVITDKGLELIIFNGTQSRTILSNNDNVDGSVLRSFFFGFMTEQVDDSGRIVLTGNFGDGSTSLIVGIPV
jgi:hypothetical protein